MKVHIKNFQSIEDVSFEIPEKQFTCIVGPSNIGKSALRRAFECLIYNNSEASYIRKGTKTCSIEVTFDDGSIIKWYRNKKTAGYVIDGDDFTKLAGTVPETLVLKGYKELIINKDKYPVQIASQFNNIFLLNQTGGKVTEVLSNLGNLNKIIKSNKSCQTDLKASKSKLSVRREDILSSKEKLKSYKGLDEQRNLMSNLKDNLKDIKKSKDIVDSVKLVSKNLDIAVFKVKTLRPVKDINIQSFDLDINKLTNSKKLLLKLVKSRRSLQAHSKLKEIQDISLNISLDILLSLRRLSSLYSSRIVKQDHFLRLSNISDIEFNLKDEYDRYTLIYSYLSKIDRVKHKLVLYKNMPSTINISLNLDVAKLPKMRELSYRLSSIKDKIISLREEIKKADKKIINLKKEEEDLHKSLGVCPLCNKEF